MPKNYLAAENRLDNVRDGVNFGLNTNIITRNIHLKLTEAGHKKPTEAVGGFIQSYGYRSPDAAGIAGGTIGGYIYHVNPEATITAIMNEQSIIKTLENQNTSIQSELPNIDKSESEYTDKISRLILNQFLLGIVYECEGYLAYDQDDNEGAYAFYTASQTSFECAKTTFENNRKLYKSSSETNEWQTTQGKSIWTRRATPEKECELKLNVLTTKIDLSKPTEEKSHKKQKLDG